MGYFKDARLITITFSLDPIFKCSDLMNVVFFCLLND
jgi:hypothetical protein